MESLFVCGKLAVDTLRMLLEPVLDYSLLYWRLYLENKLLGAGVLLVIFDNNINLRYFRTSGVPSEWARSRWTSATIALNLQPQLAGFLCFLFHYFFYILYPP